jgi:hypothetical protein
MWPLQILNPILQILPGDAKGDAFLIGLEGNDSDDLPSIIENRSTGITGVDGNAHLEERHFGNLGFGAEYAGIYGIFQLLDANARAADDRDVLAAFEFEVIGQSERRHFGFDGQESKIAFIIEVKHARRKGFFGQFLH